MGRIGLISKEVILSACEKLVASGFHPTAVNVRNELGAGSYTTILPVIQEFKQLPKKEASAKPLQAPVPPQDFSVKMSAVLHQLWAEAWEMSQKEVEQAQATFNQTLETQSQELRSKSGELESTYSHLQKYEEEIEDLKTQLKASCDDGLKRDGENAVLRQNLQSLRTENQTLQERIEQGQKQHSRELQERVSEITALNEKNNELERLKTQASDVSRRLESDLSLAKDALIKRDGELSGLRESFAAIQKANELLLERVIRAEKHSNIG